MTKERAVDCIKGNGVAWLMKCYSYHAANYQKYIARFLGAVVEHGRDIMDIPTIISMVLCPYGELQAIGVKALAIMSDNSGVGSKNLDSEFENHIPFLFEAYSNTKN